MSLNPGTQQYCEIEGARGISLRLSTVVPSLKMQ